MHNLNFLALLIFASLTLNSLEPAQNISGQNLSIQKYLLELSIIRFGDLARKCNYYSPEIINIKQKILNLIMKINQHIDLHKLFDKYGGENNNTNIYQFYLELNM